MITIKLLREGIYAGGDCFRGADLVVRAARWKRVCQGIGKNFLKRGD